MTEFPWAFLPLPGEQNGCESSLERVKSYGDKKEKTELFAEVGMLVESLVRERNVA